MNLTWKPDEKKVTPVLNEGPTLKVIWLHSEYLVIYLTWEDICWWKVRRMARRVALTQFLLNLFGQSSESLFP
jgi:hypothetical protein